MLQCWLCALVLSPPQPLQVSELGLCGAVLRRAGLRLYWIPSLWIVCLLQGSAARWAAVATAVEGGGGGGGGEAKEGAVTALSIQILQFPLPPSHLYTEDGHAPPSKTTPGSMRSVTAELPLLFHSS